MKQQQSGFTLIEIAIVLVIIGLLLGGILKGQELITSARVRNMISQQDGVKAAYFGFQDRYRSLPGDYPQNLAQQNIPNETMGCTAGTAPCQDGRINNGAGGTESIIAWSHMSKAGFINGNYNGTGTTPAATNSPTNPYGAFVQLIFDTGYDPGTPPAAVNFKTGTGVPSSILAEIDRKVDDGAPTTGIFRSSQFGPPASGCTTGTAPNVVWAAAADIKDCGGAAIF